MNQQNQNNFDFIRLFAASLVIVTHCYFLVLSWDQRQFNQEPLHFLTDAQINLGSLGIAIFFCVSGYLITQSLLRSTDYKTFFVKRALRIFPALIVIIFLTAFFLGAAFTTLPLAAYFSEWRTYQYLLNSFLFTVSDNLPGVFEQHANTGGLNGSLWTLPYECLCYLAIALLHRLWIFKNRYVFAILYFILFEVYFLNLLNIDSLSILGTNLKVKALLNLWFYFSGGALLYLFRDKIPLKFSISVVLFLVLCAGIYLKVGILCSFICLPYIVLWFALEPRIKLHKISRFGDFSYGLYIYSFPVQQTIIYYRSEQIPIWEFCILSFLFSVPLAMFS